MKKILILTLAAVAIYNLLFFQTNPGLATPLFVFLIHSYLFLTRHKDGKNIRFALILSFFSILFSFFFAWRANEIIKSLDIAATFALTFYAMYLYKKSSLIEENVQQFILAPFNLGLSILESVFGLLRKDAPEGNNSNEYSLSGVVRGLIITVPVILVLLVLLTSADPIFKHLVDIALKNVKDRLVESTIFATIFLTLGITYAKEFIRPLISKTIQKGKGQELTILLGSIALVFGAFILVQIKYLFAVVSERELSQLGIASLTYSEYVKKGFFELIITSLISVGTLSYGLTYVHYLEKKEKKRLTGISLAVIIETGLLVLSAFKRTILYADAHGLTRARLMGFFFLFFLLFFLIYLFIHTLKNLSGKNFFRFTASLIIVFLTFINIVNIDRMIATVYKPHVNNEIDYFYLSSLSPDALEGWNSTLVYLGEMTPYLENVKLWTTEDNRKRILATETAYSLLYQTEHIISIYGTVDEIKRFPEAFPEDIMKKIGENPSESSLPSYARIYRKWQSKNISEYEAYLKIKNNPLYFMLPSILDRLNKVGEKVPPEIQQDTHLDRTMEPIFL